MARVAKRALVYLPNLTFQITCVTDQETPPGLWQLNTEFLVERSTGTQCRQGLRGRPALEESYMGLPEKNSYSPPTRKRTPYSNGANG